MWPKYPREASRTPRLARMRPACFGSKVGRGRGDGAGGETPREEEPLKDRQGEPAPRPAGDMKEEVGRGGPDRSPEDHVSRRDEIGDVQPAAQQRSRHAPELGGA